jgi:rhodanese-related sulfurtransferase
MSAPLSGTDRISAEELKCRLDRGEPLVVLDVREDEERAFCALPVPSTAINLHIPIGQIPTRFDELERSAAKGPLVVYCHLGVRSRAVADWLLRQGVTQVVDVEGGIDAWSTRVDPSVRRY